MHAFDYIRPTSIEEAAKLLSGASGHAAILAGGTDIVNRLQRGETTPELVIDLKGIEGLQDITYSAAEGLAIGAIATMRQVGSHDQVKRHYPLLAQVCNTMAVLQIRNRATLGGNLIAAPTHSDVTPVLLCFDASVDMLLPSGREVVSLSSFFNPDGSTALGTEGIILRVLLPASSLKTFGKFRKLTRSPGSTEALAGIAATATDNDERATSWRIAITALSPYPKRVPEAEAILDKGLPNKKKLKKVIDCIAAACIVEDSVLASAEYRTAMARVLARRTINDVIAAQTEET